MTASPAAAPHAAARPPAPATPRLVGRMVRLRPVTGHDYDFLFRLYTDGDHLVQYRLRGRTPSPEAFVRHLWDEVVAQFIVETPDGRPIGIVSAFEANFRNRYAYVAACSVPELETTGLVLEGVALLVSYLFETFDLRKVYAETLESSFARFSLGDGRIFDVEGRLTEHEYVHGRYQDLLLLAVFRTSWRHHHLRIFGEEGRF